MEKQTIIIVGAGLIGLSSAFFLAKSGHNVIVLEEKETFGLGASFANGGQISASYSQPWASFDNLKKIIHYLGQEQSPILYRPKFENHQFLWMLDFLKQCLPNNNEKNIREMLKLSLYSRETLNIIRKEYNFDYAQKINGIITFYQNETAFNEAKKSADIMRKFGLNRNILNKEQTLELEPVLNNKGFNLYGSDYTKEDESGDAYLWMKNIYDICKNELNVNFLFNHKVVNFTLTENNNEKKISSIIVNIIDDNEDLNNNKPFFINEFDKIIIANGSNSYILGKLLDINTNIYPVKGYSATLTPKKEYKNLINKISLTDSQNKIVFTNLNDKLRIAGTAEFNGYDYGLNRFRVDFLRKKAIDYFENIFEENPEYWTGLRPTTTTGIPYIGKIKNSNINNLFFNTGHGTLGWTMAAGSGRLINQIINNKDSFGDFLW